MPSKQRRTTTCGTRLESANGAPLDCARTGRHIAHRTTSGDTFVRAPGGAIIYPATSDTN